MTTDPAADRYTGTTGCYCLCAVAHPKTDGICKPANAVTTRDVKGRPVQMCAPCAAAHDAKAPKPKAAPVVIPRVHDTLDERLMAHAATMPADDAERLRDALAYIREAWAGNDHADPAAALECIADNATAAMHLMRGETTQPVLNDGRGPVIFRKATV
jgi:hypothetical protein